MNGKIIITVFLVAMTAMCVSNPPDTDPGFTNDGKLKKFGSVEEIKAFLKENTGSGGYRGYLTMDAAMESAPLVVMGCGGGDVVASAPPAQAKTTAEDFSTTNIQVQEVDEADIVKNDGKYIYVLTGNKVSIIDAYPPEGARILSVIQMEGSPRELYINGDRLIVLGNDYREYPVPVDGKMAPEAEMMPYPRPGSTTSFVRIYDIFDRERPELEREVMVDGDYFDSRMVDDNVYVIATQPAYYYDDVIRVPEIDTGAESMVPDVYYFDDAPDSSYTFTTVMSVNVQDDGEVEGKVYLLGTSQNLYVSRDNIYITYQKRVPPTYVMERTLEAVIRPLVPGEVYERMEEIQTSEEPQGEKEDHIGKVLEGYLGLLTHEARKELERDFMERMESLERDMQKETEKTVVHRIEIKDGDIEYRATGEVPGRVLNQFSMDEHDGFFRMATTTGEVWARGAQASANHIYVLDGEMRIVGALEDLAPGERIYSARFMGKRAYLVTFKKVDPLFVIDLSDPEGPEVLGKLKIPGYSDYLHPYDEDHIIGIGKDTVEAEQGDFAWYQGVKVALFDVSDVEHPKEISKYVIGDRGTDSEALHDHKAFLFSRERNLMVIPVLLAEVQEDNYPERSWGPRYGEYVWQGAYVFRIDTHNGIQFRGGISHASDTDDYEKTGRYYMGSKYAIKRSLYMDSTLYTISDGMVKMNDLRNLEEVNRVELPGYKEEPVYHLE
jgi:uncharacterized secreted protein with C-terminal beta-propeller domain